MLSGNDGYEISHASFDTLADDGDGVSVQRHLFGRCRQTNEHGRGGLDCEGRAELRNRCLASGLPELCDGVGGHSEGNVFAFGNVLLDDFQYTQSRRTVFIVFVEIVGMEEELCDARVGGGIVQIILIIPTYARRLSSSISSGSDEKIDA